MIQQYSIMIPTAATPTKPWNADSPVNTNNQWFPMVSKWCRNKFHPPAVPSASAKPSNPKAWDRSCFVAAWAWNAPPRKRRSAMTSGATRSDAANRFSRLTPPQAGGGWQHLSSEPRKWLWTPSRSESKLNSFGCWTL